jgi:hypothetical protein
MSLDEIFDQFWLSTGATVQEGAVAHKWVFFSKWIIFNDLMGVKQEQLIT